MSHKNKKMSDFIKTGKTDFRKTGFGKIKEEDSNSNSGVSEDSDNRPKRRR